MKNLKKHLPLLIFFFLLTLTIVFGAIDIILKKKTDGQPQVSYSSVVPTAPTPQPTSSVIPLPVPLSDRIVSLFLSYVFRGTIKNVSKTEFGTRLIMEPSDHIPPLVVDNKTPIFKTNQQQEIPATIADITTGMHVVIAANYNVRTKMWIVPRVFLPMNH